MFNIIFYGFIEIQSKVIQKYSGSLWNSIEIPDNGSRNSKSSYESWRTTDFAKNVKISSISMKEVNNELEKISTSVMMSMLNLECRTDNTYIPDAILAIKMRIKVFLEIFSTNNIDRIILRTPPQTSAGLLLAELGRIKSIPVLYFDNCTPTNSVHLCEYDISKIKLKLNKIKSKYEPHKLNDHLNSGIRKFRTRPYTNNNILLFFETFKFVIKNSFKLALRSFIFFLKSIKASISNKYFNLITHGNYSKIENGFSFFFRLAVSEIHLVRILIWYEIKAYFDWVSRDKNLDKTTILFLSSYQPERTTCPDSHGFNDPRLCVIESSRLKRVFYKEHPTIFTRHRNIIYRSGKCRSLNFYRDIKNLSSNNVIFCPTILNTHQLASTVHSVHTIASSFVSENRGSVKGINLSKPIKITCYTDNWYTNYKGISSYNKLGTSLIDGKSTFKEIQNYYLSGLHSKPSENMFSSDLIELLVKNINQI